MGSNANHRFSENTFHAMIFLHRSQRAPPQGAINWGGPSGATHRRPLQGREYIRYTRFCGSNDEAERLVAHVTTYPEATPTGPLTYWMIVVFWYQ